ncbi:helix-turn-helix domain-containing protein [Kineosporia babensis]|uniref:MerR family transcriptional regulator n=1 Tax=Kineosporia babensis TaxID=499548 RepID=A0A9X1STF4_9ACTN|nr:MerR family transcriptional regulator [Kineosporia babensis]MCD5311814.1 MerR family transcriptional regulator [Kineosporia babensis]
METAAENLYPIGDVARRTGLAVSAIRFYSDEGIVTPAGQNTAGHRLYDLHTVAQLEFIRTLRDLDTGLDEIRQVLTGEKTLRYVLAEHLELVEQQGSALLARRAVLRALVKHQAPAERATLMHRLVAMPDVERERLVDDFWNEVGADLPTDFVHRLGRMRPALPEDPSATQLQAWVELAELLQDRSFRSEVRQYLREVHGQGPGIQMSSGPVQDMTHQLGSGVVEHMIAARRSGLAPETPHAQELVRRLVCESGQPFGVEDSPERRERMAQAYEIFQKMQPQLNNDEEYDATHGRYLALVATINGQPSDAPLTIAADLNDMIDWIVSALRAKE